MRKNELYSVDLVQFFCTFASNCKWICHLNKRVGRGGVWIIWGGTYIRDRGSELERLDRRGFLQK